MKKLFITAILAIVFCGSGAAYAQKGDMAVGVSVDYANAVEAAGIGVKFNYGITDNIRISPNFHYYFEDDSFWDINIDFHYLLPVARSFNAYPVLGFTFANVDWGMGNTTKFGINLGVGAEYNISRSFAVNFDVVYKMTPIIDQAVISFGVAYKF